MRIPLNVRSQSSVAKILTVLNWIYLRHAGMIGSLRWRNWWSFRMWDGLVWKQGIPNIAQHPWVSRGVSWNFELSRLIMPFEIMRETVFIVKFTNHASEISRLRFKNVPQNSGYPQNPWNLPIKIVNLGWIRIHIHIPCVEDVYPPE